MPLKVQTPLVGQALQRLFSIQGRVVPVLEESIVPMVLVGDVSQGGTPDVQRAAVASGVAAAVAAEFSSANLQVPPGVIAKILAITCWPAAETNLLVSFANQAIALAAQPQTRFTDNRLAGGVTVLQTPASVMNVGTSGAQTFPVHATYRAHTTSLGVRIEPAHWFVGGLSVVGTAGQAGQLELQMELANTTAIFCIEWAEFPAF